MSIIRCAFALALALSLGSSSTVVVGQTAGGRLESRLERLEQAVAARGPDFNVAGAPELAPRAVDLEEAAAQLAGSLATADPQSGLATIESLLTAKERVDALLEDLLKRRGKFGEASDSVDRAAVREYLRTTSQLIDLSGRLRYIQFDLLTSAAGRLGNSPELLMQLSAALAKHRSDIGAGVLVRQVLDPEAGRRGGNMSAADRKLTIEVLKLAAASRHLDLVPPLARFVRLEGLPPDLLLLAAETIRHLGMPQDARPDQDAALPQPAITAEDLWKRLTPIDPARLPGDMPARHAELIAWLDARRQKGASEESFRLGPFDIREGDWMLMRNPSPYNLFTDLSPGLFTHVGIATWETASDGRRRMVIVDLPERGTHMPATNADIFVQRTLHYVFLRHPDPQVAQTMARIAAELIGNETEFDLNFRTDRVNELRGQPLADRKIKTYCAGLLLICAQETSAPRSEFFPFTEHQLGGNTQTNAAKFGLSMGEGFVSPTGALFSPKLELVGRREPMYDPRRQIEEAIYDHFAEGLVSKQLVPSHSWSQAFKVKLAQASRWNKLLADTIADAVGVHRDTDLVSAAKAGAVVETLDEIAQGASKQFLESRDAVRQNGATTSRANELRRRHADLVQAWSSRQLAPRQLRQSLTRYYIEWGKRQIDERFFAQP